MDDAQLRREMEGLSFYHTISLTPTLSTPGWPVVVPIVEMALRALRKVDLRGKRVLDIGCGWGATLKRAIERHDVNVIGLTLSKNQHAASVKLLDQVDTDRTRRILMRGWEEFDEPVDRILSIEAFEHFGFERYDEFFEKCYRILPEDGRLTIQSNVSYHPDEFRELKERAREMGFVHVESGPLVRSSYHAHETADAYAAAAR